MSKSTSARGYGHMHQQRRKRWSPQVEAGHVNCARCGRLIEPGTPWDLGHTDGSRTQYAGPEHRTCNRQTMYHGERGISSTTRRTPLHWSRIWWEPIPDNVENKEQLIRDWKNR